MKIAEGMFLQGFKIITHSTYMEGRVTFGTAWLLQSIIIGWLSELTLMILLTLQVR